MQMSPGGVAIQMLGGQAAREAGVAAALVNQRAEEDAMRDAEWRVLEREHAALQADHAERLAQLERRPEHQTLAAADAAAAKYAAEAAVLRLDNSRLKVAAYAAAAKEETAVAQGEREAAATEEAVEAEAAAASEAAAAAEEEHEERVRPHTKGTKHRTRGHADHHHHRHSHGGHGHKAASPSPSATALTKPSRGGAFATPIIMQMMDTIACVKPRDSAGDGY